MFIYNIEGIAQKMKIDFDGITNIITHNGLKGSAREELLKKYLRELLPKKYAITGGIICDSSGNQSRQQDFIIYDSFTNASFYQFESNSILPIESVYATIEIKSSLNTTTLKECIENVNSVKKLEKIGNNNGIKFVNNFSNTYPLGFVFAYTSRMSLKQIILKLAEYEKDIEEKNRISIICILDKGLVLRVNKNNLEKVSFNTENTLPVFSNSTLKDSLYSFYLLLLEYLNNVFIETPSLIRYAEKTNSFNIKYTIAPELLPDDSFYRHKETGIPYNVFREIDSRIKKYPHMFDGKMTYNDMFNYLTKDYIIISELMSNYTDTKSYDFYGYVMSKSEYNVYRNRINEYDSNKESKEYVDTIINKIYECYQKQVNNK